MTSVSVTASPLSSMDQSPAVPDGTMHQGTTVSCASVSSVVLAGEVLPLIVTTHNSTVVDVGIDTAGAHYRSLDLVLRHQVTLALWACDLE